jgi:hypothetical protein
MRNAAAGATNVRQNKTRLATKTIMKEVMNLRRRQVMHLSHDLWSLD